MVIAFALVLEPLNDPVPCNCYRDIVILPNKHNKRKKRKRLTECCSLCGMLSMVTSLYHLMNLCVFLFSMYAFCRPRSCTFLHNACAWEKWNVHCTVHPFTVMSGNSLATVHHRAQSRSWMQQQQAGFSQLLSFCQITDCSNFTSSK